MSEDRDPIAAASDHDRDLYDVAVWESRTRLDRVSVVLAAWLQRLGRATVVFVALAILLAQLVLSGLAAISEPAVGVFILLSVLPAVLIVVFIWQADVTKREPLSTLVGTFLLGVLLASFAAVLNTIASPLFAAIPYVGIAAFYFLVVGPVEETVKLLAVRLYAYRLPAFSAVIDGAVYGAVAGLGFATIENTIYIGQGYLEASQAGAGAIDATVGTAAVRSLAGPGHVIYSGIVGYYLGLAKFNREWAGPIVVKGLLIGTIAHGSYNTLVGIVPELLVVQFGLAWPVAFIGFVGVFDGVLGYYLYAKIVRYGRVYRETVGADTSEAEWERDRNRERDDGDRRTVAGTDVSVAGSERTDDEGRETASPSVSGNPELADEEASDQADRNETE